MQLGPGRYFYLSEPDVWVVMGYPRKKAIPYIQNWIGSFIAQV